MAYPAEKLIALKSTTTPALTTQVINVGLIIISSRDARRFFLDSRLSFEVDAFRLPLSCVDAALEDAAECLRAAFR